MDIVRKQQMLAGVPLEPEKREPTHEERKQQMLASLPVDTAALAERRDPKEVKHGRGTLHMPPKFAAVGGRLMDDVIHKSSRMMDVRTLGRFTSLDSLTDLLASAKSMKESADALVKWVAKEKRDFEHRLKTEKPED